MSVYAVNQLNYQALLQGLSTNVDQVTLTLEMLSPELVNSSPQLQSVHQKVHQAKNLLATGFRIESVRSEIWVHISTSFNPSESDKELCTYLSERALKILLEVYKLIENSNKSTLNYLQNNLHAVPNNHLD